MESVAHSLEMMAEVAKYLSRSLVAFSPRFPAELQPDRNEGSIIRIALGVIVHPQLDRESDWKTQQPPIWLLFHYDLVLISKTTGMIDQTTMVQSTPDPNRR